MSHVISALIGAVVLFLGAVIWQAITSRRPVMADQCEKRFSSNPGDNAISYRCQRNDGHDGACASYDKQFDVWWQPRSKS